MVLVLGMNVGGRPWLVLLVAEALAFALRCDRPGSGVSWGTEHGQAVLALWAASPR
jgi:hypothetical protein